MPTMPETFRPAYEPTRKETGRTHDLARGSARARGYNHRWDKVSKRFLVANPLCLACQCAGRIERARVTDHIIPHKGDRALFWKMDNWQPACGWHHDVIKQKLERLFVDGLINEADLMLTSAYALRLAAGMRVH